MLMHVLVRRLLSPVGFVLVGVCFLLPFLVAGRQQAEPLAVNGDRQVVGVHASYSGVDLLAGGLADRALRERRWDQARGAYTVQEVDLGEAVSPEFPNVRLPRQTWADAVAVLVVVGVAAELLVGAIVRARARLIVAVAAAGALITAVVEARGELATVAARVLPPYTGGPINPDDLARHVRPGYGFWLALGLLVVIAVGNAWMAMGRPVRRAPTGAGTLNKRDDH